jgi:parallel beta-helix repeat protein
LENFTIQNTIGDGIKVQYTDGIVFRNVKAEWTGGPKETNGAYGLYPVQCSNVLIEHSMSIGASDAGLYVGQSKNIIVRNSEVYHNVAGIEIENSINADVYNNYAHDNTGGILIFDLPDLIQKSGKNVRIFNNLIENNNLDNFAPEGNIVGQVPPGTGIMVMAVEKVEIFKNTIRNNKTAGTTIVSYFITEEAIKDSLYNPYTASIYIHDNIYERESQLPTLNHDIGVLLALRFRCHVPDIIYDGMPDPRYANADGQIPADRRLCLENNLNAGYVNLDISKNFNKWYSPFIASFSTDIDECNCSQTPISAVKLNIIE